MGLFRRSDPTVELDDDPHAAIRAAIATVAGRRSDLSPLGLGELPVLQGLATLHADTVAALTLRAERNAQPVSAQPAIVTRPDPDEPVGITVHKVVQSLFWHGNAYALVTWPETGGPALALKVVNPLSVSPNVDQADPLRVETWNIDGTEWPRSSVMHIKLNDDPARGPLGESPLTRCAMAIDWYGWAYRYLGDAFAQGGVPTSTLTSKRRLTSARATAAVDAWITARQQRRPAVLGPDWELDVPPPMDLSGVVEVLEWAVSELCRALNVPPSLGNARAGGSLTYSNVTDELRRWLAVSLRPTWLSRIERAWSELLVRGQTARFVDEDLYRLDPAAPVPAGPAAAGVIPQTSGVEVAP